MPRRTDLKRVLIIGSGPIVIGQACEFDYSGTQACKALRAEGLEVVLVNCNPATIMTDPDLADRTYVEPLTQSSSKRSSSANAPTRLLPTVGGQTALNLAVDSRRRACSTTTRRDDWRTSRRQDGRRSAALQAGDARDRPGNPAKRSVAAHCPTRSTAIESTRLSGRDSSFVHAWRNRRRHRVQQRRVREIMQRDSISARCTKFWSKNRSSAGRNTNSR